MSIQTDAEAYVELINSPPNGWGQHVHPQYGQSHAYLYAMQKQHGKAEFDAAVDEAFRARRTV